MQIKKQLKNSYEKVNKDRLFVILHQILRFSVVQYADTGSKNPSDRSSEGADVI